VVSKWYISGRGSDGEGERTRAYAYRAEDTELGGRKCFEKKTLFDQCSSPGARTETVNYSMIG
jgi:hypothetical protein